MTKQEPVALTKLDDGILIDAKEAGFEVTNQGEILVNCDYQIEWDITYELSNFAELQQKRLNANEWKEYALKLREALMGCVSSLMGYRSNIDDLQLCDAEKIGIKLLALPLPKD